MASMKRISSLLLAGCAVTTLAACGADDVASPGEGVIVIPAPTPGPTPTPGPGPTPTPTPGQAAAACPSGGFIDRGVIGSRRSCELPTRFTVDTTLQNVPGVAYAISGPVNVGTDIGGPGNAAGGQAVTLTIQPGSVLFGSAGSDYLVVNRGSRLTANGTVSQPIIFTARANLEGTVTDSSQGLWGGVILLGRAPISDCNTAVAGGDANCQQVIEGTTSSLYGGAVATDNSGSLRNVQIRYSGFQIAPGNELQGLTMGGVGSNTVIDSVQIHNSSDDGIEIFGGRVNARNLLLTGADDDALDTDLGYQGFIQYVLAIQKPTGDGDSAIEADSNGNEEALPRQNTRVSNATFVYPRVGSGGNVILLRGGTDYTLVNAAVVGAGACIDIDATNNTTTRPADAALQDVGPPVFNSVVLSCPTAFRADGNEAAVSTIFGAGTNNNSAFTSTLSSVYINGAGETAVPAFNASTINAFFENAGYIGAVRNSSDNRFAGWSCNSGYANFGGTSGSCTAIPTT